MNVLAHASYTQQRAWSKYSARAAQWSLLARTPEHLQIESIAKYRFFHRAIFHPNFDVRIAMFPPNMCQNTNKKHFYEGNGVNSAQCCGGAVERYDEHHRSIRTAHWNILCADECVCDVQLRGRHAPIRWWSVSWGDCIHFLMYQIRAKRGLAAYRHACLIIFFSLAKKKNVLRTVQHTNRCGWRLFDANPIFIVRRCWTLRLPSSPHRSICGAKLIFFLMVFAVIHRFSLLHSSQISFVCSLTLHFGFV